MDVPVKVPWRLILIDIPEATDLIQQLKQRGLPVTVLKRDSVTDYSTMAQTNELFRWKLIEKKKESYKGVDGKNGHRYHGKERRERGRQSAQDRLTNLRKNFKPRKPSRTPISHESSLQIIDDIKRALRKKKESCVCKSKGDSPSSKDLSRDPGVSSSNGNDSPPSRVSSKEVTARKSVHFKTTETRSPSSGPSSPPVSPIHRLDEPENKDDMESMEWEPIPEEVLLSHIKTVREAVEVNSSEKIFDQNLPGIDGTPKKSNVYVVVDTNILVGSFSLLQTLISSKVRGMDTKLVIPWQVLRELDFLKDKRSGDGITRLAGNARRASNFLLTHSDEICWQSQADYNAPLEGFVSEVADDQILKCCLQLKSKGYNVVLFSNDRNLCLKTSANNLPALTEDGFNSVVTQSQNKPSEHCVVDLEEPPADGQCPVFLMAHKFALMFNQFISTCIEDGLRRRYGEMWQWHACIKRPWSLIDAITCAHLQWSLFTGVENCSRDIKNLKVIQEFFTTHTYDYALNEDALINVLQKSIELVVNMPFPFQALAKLFKSSVDEMLLQLKNDVKVAQVEGVNRSVRQLRSYDNQVKEFMCAMERGDIDRSVLEGSLKKYIASLQSIVAALYSLNLVERGTVTLKTHGVKELHNAVTNILESATEQNFSPSDVVYFSNDPEVRKSMDEARESLQETLRILLAKKNSLKR